MKRSMSMFLAFLLLAASTVLPAWALEPKQALDQTAQYVQTTVADPQVASVGGEWAVIGLARSGLEVPQSWYDTYYTNLTSFTIKQQGVLSTRKYTEYARVVLALTALGKDPRTVAGYDLLAPLEDVEATVRQGVNGAIYALIALDSGNYAVSEGVREQYLAYLMAAQLPDGGWALAGERSDPDITAQALQALAPYSSQAGEAIDRGLAALDAMLEQGSFTTLESYAQAIIALCTLQRQPSDRLLEGFFSYRLSNGGFRHLPDGSVDGMATEQGLCALAALVRYEGGEPALYQMDAPQANAQSGPDGVPALLLCALLALLPSCTLGLGLPAGN